MDRDLIRAVSEETAERVVKRTLVAVGINPDDPLEAQETSAAIRKVAKHAPHIEAMVAHYKDPSTVEAIQFAKKAHGAYTSTQNRVVAVGSAAVLTLWFSGLAEKIRTMF